MSTSDPDPKSDRLSKDYQEGPNPSPGGKIDTAESAIPPYEGRTDGSSDPSGLGASVERQAAEDDHSGGGTASPAQESPVQEEELSDSEPESPKGVGESVGTRGEDIMDRDGKERGRHEGGEDGAGRPKGHSDDSDSTGL